MIVRNPLYLAFSLSLVAISGVAQANETYAPYYYADGVYKTKTGDLEGAINDFNSAIKFDPRFLKAYIKSSRIKHFYGDYSGAIEDLDKALSFYPNNVSALLIRASAKDVLKDYKGSYSDCQRGE